MTNFENLRELVKSGMPQQLEAFDRLAFRLRRFQQEDDIILFIEAAGFVALLTQQVPQAILDSNATYRATLETLKGAVETWREDKAALERAHSWAQLTAKQLDETGNKLTKLALDTVTKLDTKALSEKLSAALLQSIEQSVEARKEIIESTKALKDVSGLYRNEVRAFKKQRMAWMFTLAWTSAFLIFGTLYFIGWEKHRHYLEDQARAQLAATLDAVRLLQKRGIEMKVTHDHDTVYVIIPEASRAYLSNQGEGVIALETPP